MQEGTRYPELTPLPTTILIPTQTNPTQPNHPTPPGQLLPSSFGWVFVVGVAAVSIIQGHVGTVTYVVARESFPGNTEAQQALARYLSMFNQVGNVVGTYACLGLAALVF